MMNPRLIVWIITHTINLELKQLKRNKLGIFLDCIFFLRKTVISENCFLILKGKGHFYIPL